MRWLLGALGFTAAVVMTHPVPARGVEDEPPVIARDRRAEGLEAGTHRTPRGGTQVSAVRV